MALRIFFYKIGEVFRQFDLAEPVRLVKRACFRKLRDFLRELFLLAEQPLRSRVVGQIQFDGRLLRSLFRDGFLYLELALQKHVEVSREVAAQALVIRRACEELPCLRAEIFRQVFRQRFRRGAEFRCKRREIKKVLVMEQRRGRAPLFFDPVPEADEDVVEGLHGPGEDIGGVVFAALFVGAKQLLEERRINLRAAIVLGPDVIEVSAVRQGVLGDDINVPAIELPV